MTLITAPPEWLEFCSDQLSQSKRRIARKLYAKYGNDVPFPMFLHVDLCNALYAVFTFSPSKEEADKFITQAITQISERFKE
jgi:hypothetical protein